ncbi:MAG TPA: serine protease [Pirellulaceae bacterium]|nr:serine protease [Pirellulaceae bacterium]
MTRRPCSLLPRGLLSNSAWRPMVTLAAVAVLWFSIGDTNAMARPRDWADQGTAASKQPSWMLFSLGDRSPHPAVARITAVDGNAVSQGSGTLIDVRGQHGLIITNWHVIRDATGPIIATFPDGFRSAATVLKVDQDWDLAAILIWRPRTEPIAISMTAPRPGDTLTIAGYGSGSYRAVTGHCTQYVAPGRRMPYEMVEVSAEARQGDSGGPILNERGELAGVLFGAGGGATSGTYCGRVRWFLESAWPAEQTPDTDMLVSVPAHQPITRWPADGLTAIPQSATPPQRTFGEPAPNYSTGATPTPATVSTADRQEPARSLNLGELVGHTPLERSKTILAAIGLLAVVLQVGRVLGGRDRRK